MPRNNASGWVTLPADSKILAPENQARNEQKINGRRAGGFNDEAQSWGSDTNNPQNWSAARKWTTVVVVGWLQFVSPLASVMLGPSLPQIATDLHITSSPLLTFTLSIYLLGSAVSALLAAPLSEVFGRLLYIGSSALFLAFTLGCGFSNSALTLLILRLLAGALGSACLSVGAGTMADLFERHQRGKAMSFSAGVLLLGPCVGPVIGGLVTQSLGWRPVFYVIGGIAGFNVLLAFVLLKETHHSTLLRARRRKANLSGDTEPIRNAESMETGTALGWPFVRHAILVTLKLLFRSPVVVLCSIANACVFGVLYLILSTLSEVFGSRYGFSPREVGLVYLAPGGGLLAGLFIVGRLSDRLATRRKKQPPTGTTAQENSQAEKQYQPEARLSLIFAIPGLLLTVTGLLVYGWPIEYHIHWGVAVTGLFIFGSGILLMTSPALIYLVDCYPKHAASVSAATALLRSILTGLLPLCGLAMYDVLGYGYGVTVLAGVIVVASAINLVCRGKGSQLRRKSPPVALVQTTHEQSRHQPRERMRDWLCLNRPTVDNGDKIFIDDDQVRQVVQLHIGDTRFLQDRLLKREIVTLDVDRSNFGDWKNSLTIFLDSLGPLYRAVIEDPRFLRTNGLPRYFGDDYSEAFLRWQKMCWLQRNRFVVDIIKETIEPVISEYITEHPTAFDVYIGLSRRDLRSAAFREGAGEELARKIATM